MDYICKVLTPEFKERWDAQIIIEVDYALSKHHTNREQRPILAQFEESTIRSGFCNMWNNPQQFAANSACRAYYTELKLWEPEYTNVTFSSQEKGYQSQPRILWNGVITKIEDIDEIISFVRSKSQSLV